MPLESNLKKVQYYLERNFPDGKVNNHINGQSIASKSGNTFKTFSPTDMQSLADVQESNKEDINSAVQAAVDSFSGWSEMPGNERKKILLKNLHQKNFDLTTFLIQSSPQYIFCLL